MSFFCASYKLRNDEPGNLADLTNDECHDFILPADYLSATDAKRPSLLKSSSVSAFNAESTVFDQPKESSSANMACGVPARGSPRNINHAYRRRSTRGRIEKGTSLREPPKCEYCPSESLAKACKARSGGKHVCPYQRRS